MKNMMLNQFVALEKGIKANVNERFTKAYQMLAKTPLLNGLSRVYTPKNDGDEVLPSESSLVQVRVTEVLKGVEGDLSRFWNISATRDFGNCVATADIVVNDVVLVEKAPISYLLFLEKQLVDVHTFIKKLPVQDPTEVWTWDSALNVYRSAPVETVRTKKIPRNHVKSEATDKHPAQVEVYQEDVSVGRWNATKFTGALAPSTIRELLDRVETLQGAVKVAREKANATLVSDNNSGDYLTGYIFSNVTK